MDPWIGDDFVELVKLEITFVVTRILGFLTICFCTLFQKQHKMAAEVWKSPEYLGEYIICENNRSLHS